MDIYWEWMCFFEPYKAGKKYISIKIFKNLCLNNILNNIYRGQKFIVQNEPITVMLKTMKSTKTFDLGGGRGSETIWFSNEEGGWGCKSQSIKNFFFSASEQ